MKKLVPLLLKIYIESGNSYLKSDKNNKQNTYIYTEDYKKTKAELEEKFESFKKITINTLRIQITIVTTLLVISNRIYRHLNYFQKKIKYLQDKYATYSKRMNTIWKDSMKHTSSLMTIKI